MARSTCRFNERPAGGGRLRAWCTLEAHGSSGARQGQGTLGFLVLFSFWAPMGRFRFWACGSIGLKIGFVYYCNWAVHN
ncbi:hypothetical protein ES332_D09G091200v1 [Gossypium tomentosum]|uniref:Uncharacterized protein n=1 Tax=Gossypium tomentosum TaxID=34277 RepID=A0A5D2JF69_GOSTO|nr:hypothetical protein ES332_D09G091200v1 [Gossypium tomentosum]